jgi:D-aspartate ligase
MNPVRAEPAWPPAVIAGAYRTGVLGVRSLVRRGVRATCVDCNPTYPGFNSIYCRAHECPNPDIDPAGWVNFMVTLAGTFHSKPVLISSADQYTSAIAEHFDRLQDHYLLSSGARLQGLLATKATQYELAEGHAMPLPRTAVATSADDVRAFAADAQFPCLIKPLHFREWQALPETNPLSDRKVGIAESASDLLGLWRSAASANPKVILQEIIDGADTSKRVYVSCYDAAHRRIGHAMFRELRCDPVGFGPASVTEPVVDAAVDEICDRFLRSISFSGICEIEMKIDARDGRPKLIEANPRLSGGGDAAPYSGVDLCWLHYLDLIGQVVEPVGPNGDDFRHIVLRSDVRTILSYRRAKLISWGDVVRSYRRPLAFYDFDRRDWRYSIETLYVMMRSLARGLLDRITRPREETRVAEAIVRR